MLISHDELTRTFHYDPKTGDFTRKVRTRGARQGDKNNSSGHIGVHWASRDAKWCASIQVAGRRRWLGRFDTLDDAKDAYLAAKAELHPFQPVPREVAV